jgi:uncharacterized protein with von Willebrand factor type A (vWA) domain
LSYDFKIAGGGIAKPFGEIVDVIDLVSKYVKDPKVAMICAATMFTLNMASNVYDEKDAIYTLSLNILSKNLSSPYNNPSLETKYCGAGNYSVN